MATIKGNSLHILNASSIRQHENATPRQTTQSTLMYIKYDIADSEKFDQARYLDVASELHGLLQSLAHMESNYKSSIIISYLKDHSIQMNWLNGNNKLARAVISRSHATSHIEALFDGCRNNKSFQRDFEAYITAQVQTSRCI